MMNIHISPTKSIYVPAEVVHIIFRFATYAVGQLDVSISPTFAPLSDLEREHSWAISDFTKAALLQVDKAFHASAIVFKWEYLRLRNIIEISRVGALFRNSKKRPHQFCYCGDYGKWTRRLDLRILELDNREQISEHSHAVISLLKCCPNLRIFNDQGTWAVPYERHPTPSPTVATLAASCGPSLQMITWLKGLGPSRDDFVLIIKSSPHLQTLCLDFAMEKVPFTAQCVGEISLPNLAQVQINLDQTWIAGVLATWDLPCLVEIIATGWPMGKSLSLFETLLKSHGPKLHSLSLPSPPTSRINVGQYVQHCPNLLRLAYSVESATPLSSHPHVALISLFSTNWGALPDSFGPSKSTIESVKEQLDGHFRVIARRENIPMLRQIRLPGFNGVDAGVWSRGMLGWWIEWTDQWGAMGVRLECGRGDLLRDLFQDLHAVI